MNKLRLNLQKIIFSKKIIFSNSIMAEDYKYAEIRASDKFDLVLSDVPGAQVLVDGTWVGGINVNQRTTTATTTYIRVPSTYTGNPAVRFTSVITGKIDALPNGLWRSSSSKPSLSKYITIEPEPLVIEYLVERNTTITLGVGFNYYNIWKIDWGDGTIEQYPTVASHTYTFQESFAGAKQSFAVKIYSWNTFGFIGEPNTTILASNSFISKCTSFGSWYIQNLSYAFKNATNMTSCAPLNTYLYWNNLTSPTGDPTVIPWYGNIMCMFENATKFNQSLGSWNVSNVDWMVATLDNTGLSTDNYDATLIGWAAQKLKKDVYLWAAGLTYSAAGKAARDILVGTYGWKITGDTYIETVTDVTPAAGSSDCIFSNGITELEKFIIVPGVLNTEECANGGYDEICVKTIFTQLKNYFYNEDIFQQIRDKFASFYVAIALEQRIVDSINRLVQKLLSGEINLDQFNELVKNDEQIFAGQFAKDYVTNYVKLEQDIQKYKYLLSE
jgi:hypothetical protein